MANFEPILKSRDVDIPIKDGQLIASTVIGEQGLYVDNNGTRHFITGDGTNVFVNNNKQNELRFKEDPQTQLDAMVMRDIKLVNSAVEHITQKEITGRITGNKHFHSCHFVNAVIAADADVVIDGCSTGSVEIEGGGGKLSVNSSPNLRMNGITPANWFNVSIDGIKSYSTGAVSEVKEFILGFKNAYGALQIESKPENFSDFHVCAQIIHGVYTCCVIFKISAEAEILTDASNDTYCKLNPPPPGSHRENLAAVVNYTDGVCDVKQVWGDFTVSLLCAASTAKTKLISIKIL